jgi:hypothetical protein
LPETTFKIAYLQLLYVEKHNRQLKKLRVNYIEPSGLGSRKFNFIITLGSADAWSGDINSYPIIARTDKTLYEGKEAEYLLRSLKSCSIFRLHYEK